jgi:hypothetical protein
METFTGMTTLADSQSGTYSNKKEVPVLFPPKYTAGAVSSSGAAIGSALSSTAPHYVPSFVQTNTLPTEQIRVGPGVGVDPNVPAADGFHSMLRIMPTDFGWKTNSLPGGIVPGASGIASRPSDPPPVEKQRPPTVWDQVRYPMAPGKAAVNALRVRPEDPGTGCGGSKRSESEQYFGTAGRDGSYVSAQPSRHRDDNHPSAAETNVTGARFGTGGFVNSTFDPSRLSGQRESSSTYGGVLSGAHTGMASQAFVLPSTNRANLCRDAMGNPASAVDGGAARPMDNVNRTMREQVDDRPYLTGVAAPAVKGATIQSTDKWLDREAKRYSQLLVDWMPPPCLATDGRGGQGQTRMSQRATPEMASIMPTTFTPLAMAPVGQSASSGYRPDPSNPRVGDLGIAQAQLASNPLHKPIF